MRSTWIGALGISAVLIALPASAQVSETQIGRVVEALRQAAKPEKPTNLLSDWQVTPENVSRWSKSCLGREVSPAVFQTSPSTARSIVTCVIRDVFKQEYRTSGNNEAIAVERVAAWWLTGDGDKRRSTAALPYVQKVLGFYQSASNTAQKPEATATKPGSQESFYDRYMKAGYAAVQRRDTASALLYFRRALDERPQDQFALQAIRNAEASRNRSNTSRSNSRPNDRRQ